MSEGAGPPVDPSLRRRVRIYLAILAVAIAVVAFDAWRIGRPAIVPIAAGLAAGLLLGLVASRMSALSWDVEDARVVGRIDALGAVILVGYVALVVFRGSLLAEVFDPAVVGAASVATLAGLMLGQVLGTVGGIVRVLDLAQKDTFSNARPTADNS